MFREIKDITTYNNSLCQLHCEFCPRSIDGLDLPDVKFELDKWKEVVDKAVEAGFVRFEITGIVGDPLLDPLLLDRLRYIKKLRNEGKSIQNVYIFTNLLGLTDELLHTLDNEYLTEFFEISVSIYGTTEEEYNKRTGSVGPNNFIKFCNNFRTLANACLKDKISVNELIIRYDGDDKNLNITNPIEASIFIMQRHGIDILVSGPDRDINWTDELLNITETIQDNKPEPHKYATEENPIEGACCCFIDDIGIWPNGDVGICASWFDINKKMILGNINETSLTDLINNPNSLYRQIEKEQDSGLYRSLCKHCKFLTFPKEDWFTDGHGNGKGKIPGKIKK